MAISLQDRKGCTYALGGADCEVMRLVWRLIDIPEAEIRIAVSRFRRKARFLTDECVPQSVVQMLRQVGWKVVTAAEVGLTGKPDARLLGFARDKGCLLLTFDKHFLDFRRFPLQKSPGVVVLDVDGSDSRALEECLALTVVVIAPFAPLWEETRVVISRGLRMCVWLREHDTGAVRKSVCQYRNNGWFEWVGDEAHHPSSGSL